MAYIMYDVTTTTKHVSLKLQLKHAYFVAQYVDLKRVKRIVWFLYKNKPITENQSTPRVFTTPYANKELTTIEYSMQAWCWSALM